MAKDKAPPPPVEDIPAWFMTYSDVITLLMTFFILLLTFSTTEPDRFERIQKTIFAGGKGTGVAGHKITGPEFESFVQRIRPRAARMAMNGSEMPSEVNAPSKESVGAGIRGLTDDEAKKNVMTTNEFVIPVDSIVTQEGNLTSQGTHIASMLASQLRNLPVNVSLQCSSETTLEKATCFIMYLYQNEKIRPGQAGLGLASGVPIENLKFSIEHFEK